MCSAQWYFMRCLKQMRRQNAKVFIKMKRMILCMQRLITPVRQRRPKTKIHKLFIQLMRNLRYSKSNGWHMIRWRYQARYGWYECACIEYITQQSCECPEVKSDMLVKCLRLCHHHHHRRCIICLLLKWFRPCVVLIFGFYFYFLECTQTSDQSIWQYCRWKVFIHSHMHHTSSCCRA